MRDTRYEIGSALILAVVLTSLLAIVGVMFLMVARVDRMATSGISENKELDSAVETVIAKISQELVLDIPGVAGQPDYHDYPGPEDKWLASLEPYDADPNLLVVDPCWLQISDITGYLEYKGWPTQDIAITNSAPYLFKAIIEDHKEIVLDAGGNLIEQLADADGDGVADSKWIELDDITSNKGKPIYAAIRIIDNGGMLNVNTAHKFDPNTSDGSSQMQINLMALSWHPGDPCDWYNPNDETTLLSARANYGFGGIDPFDLDEYERDVIWRYNEPNGPYTPFDISDELEVRNRFLLNHPDIDTRLEAWGGEFRDGTLSTPVTSGGQELDTWFKRAYDAGFLDPNYAYRHIGTTYNMDRIINPVGPALNNGKMVNVNVAGKDLLYYAIRTGLYDAGVPDPNSPAAQMAVNIVDYRDDNDDVSTILVDGDTYYGFERPCVYISELAHNFVPDPNDPNTVYRSYAIELYKPYSEDAVTADWRIDVDGTSIDIGSWPQTKDFYVIQNQDPNGVAILDVNSNSAAVQDSTELVFGGNSQIRLQRFVADVNDYIVVDYRQVPDPVGDWLAEDGNDHSIRRDITLHKCIRRLWSGPLVDSTLGQSNNYPPDPDPDPNMIQAHPANVDFTNIGEVGMVFRKSAYLEGADVIGPSDTEDEVRIDLVNPAYQQIFNYLTVFDPTVDGIDNNGDGYGIGVNVDPNELKIPGRININAAPWYVIGQLPWVSAHTPNYELARAIVDYRDNTVEGFESIGELNNVLNAVDPNFSIDFYARDDIDQPGFPDLTTDPPGTGIDGAVDDFEERDLIFARISNLVTVRSDVFTAYILVRIGADGPQKRVIVILDRSNVYSSDGKVRIVALHPVPDPR